MNKNVSYNIWMDLIFLKILKVIILVFKNIYTNMFVYKYRGTFLYKHV